MQTVLLVIHIMVAAALVAVVLWQRSEGGALGIGGGGGGGFLTGRGTANLLTRATATLAACFFLTSILLTIVAQQSGPKRSVFEGTPPAGTAAPADGESAPASPAPEGPRGGILDKLN
jgi:preprotein translocase subunit SecG